MTEKMKFGLARKENIVETQKKKNAGYPAVFTFPQCFSFHFNSY